MRTRSNKSTTPPAKPPAKKKKDDDSVDCGAWPESREMLRELSQYSAQKKNKLFSSQGTADPALKAIGAEVSWRTEENTCPGRKKKKAPSAVVPSQRSAPTTRRERIQLAPEEEETATKTKPRRVSLDQADKTTATPAVNRRPPIRNLYTNNKKKRTVSSTTANKNSKNKKKAPAANKKKAPPAAAMKKKTTAPAPALAPPPPAAVAAATTTAAVVESEAEGGELTQFEYAKKLINNPNAFNTLGSDEYATAESSSKGYAKKRKGCLNRFVRTILDATDPESNTPGDKVMYEMFTKKVPTNDGLTEDYLFYKNVGGKLNALKKTLMNQALMIWTLNIKNTIIFKTNFFKRSRTMTGPTPKGKDPPDPTKDPPSPQGHTKPFKELPAPFQGPPAPFKPSTPLFARSKITAMEVVPDPEIPTNPEVPTAPKVPTDPGPQSPSAKDQDITQDTALSPQGSHQPFKKHGSKVLGLEMAPVLPRYAPKAKVTPASTAPLKGQETQKPKKKQPKTKIITPQHRPHPLQLEDDVSMSTMEDESMSPEPSPLEELPPDESQDESPDESPNLRLSLRMNLRRSLRRSLRLRLRTSPRMSLWMSLLQ
ncbi:unnamed protein product [Pseudo-nitzschia multistriata]|uniref:Uncharacterized protein n=1 Tax=Pseudo-nitzschia multistriata TaxID=183589 RepID=A0A448ZMC1_9STRA|nr:unnamed protein product [Pseudo-nitzschia multistriata]